MLKPYSYKYSKIINSIHFNFLLLELTVTSINNVIYSLFTLKGELHYFFNSARFLIVELLLECRKCKTNK